jgi:hypothetical protein
MSLPKHPKTLLTVVTEALLERAVVRLARERGAQNWLVTAVRTVCARGAGRRSVP